LGKLKTFGSHYLWDVIERNLVLKLGKALGENKIEGGFKCFYSGSAFHKSC